ncbi:hypothetical protein RYH80_14390 [Halobaculum sp. MBLA0147]|uniref:hypothetical protein n=1 Tax=Halobaculum sp. MBLA0147 TaxID=3079934 RepID=UPI0035234BE4
MTEVAGRYVRLVVDSAETVSPVFAKRVRHLLARNGIAAVSDDGWYPVDAFARSLARLGEGAGSDQLGRVGGKLVAATPAVLRADDVDTALATLRRVAREAHRGPAADRVADFAVEHPDSDRTRRIVTGGDYLYPTAFAAAVFRRAVVAGVGDERVDADDVVVESVEPPADATDAFRVSW